MLTSYGKLLASLEQRGVNDPQGVLRGLPEEVIDAAPSVIEWWDGEPKLGVGMLVKAVKSGHVPAPAAQPTVPVTERLLQAVRGSCRSPDGFTRDDARSLFADAARKRGLSVDELIDRAMGTDWVETPATGGWPGAPAAARLAEERGELRVLHQSVRDDSQGLKRMKLPTGGNAA